MHELLTFGGSQPARLARQQRGSPGRSQLTQKLPAMLSNVHG
jgi:hypothetical protein